MPKRKTDPKPSPKLSLAIELPPDPRAGWEDDDEKTGSGPVDDMQPIGRVTPVPGFGEVALYEADEEPTLLGPNPTITEDDGEADYSPGVPTKWQVGIDWAHVPSGREETKRVEFIDAVAIALYARGFPVVNCYTKAKLLWEQRCKEGIR